MVNSSDSNLFPLGKVSLSKEKVEHLPAEQGKKALSSRAYNSAAHSLRVVSDCFYFITHPMYAYSRIQASITNGVYSSVQEELENYVLDKIMDFLADESNSLDDEIADSVLKIFYNAGGALVNPVVGPALTGYVMRESGGHDAVMEKVKEKVIVHTKKLRAAFVSGNKEKVREALKLIMHPDSYRGTKETCIDKDHLPLGQRLTKDEILEENFNAVVQDAVFSVLSTYIHVRMHDWIAQASSASGVINTSSQLLGTASWLIFIRNPGVIQNWLECLVLGYSVPSKERKANALALMQRYHGAKEDDLPVALAWNYMWKKGIIHIARENLGATSEKVKNFINTDLFEEPISDDKDLTNKKSFYVQSKEFFSGQFTRTYIYITESRVSQYISSSRVYTYIARKFSELRAYPSSAKARLATRVIDYTVDKAVTVLEKKLLSKELTAVEDFIAGGISIDDLIAKGISGPIMQQVYCLNSNYYFTETVFRTTGLEAYLQESITMVLSPAIESLRTNLVNIDPQETILDSVEVDASDRDALMEELSTAYMEQFAMKVVEDSLDKVLYSVVQKLIKDQPELSLLQGLQGYALDQAIEKIVLKIKPSLLKGIEKKLFQKEVLANERVKNGTELLAKLDNSVESEIAPFQAVLKYKAIKAAQEKAQNILNQGYKQAQDIMNHAKVQARGMVTSMGEAGYDLAAAHLETAAEKASEILDQAGKDVTKELLEFYEESSEIIKLYNTKSEEIANYGQKLIEEITLEKAAKVAKKGVVYSGLAYFSFLGQIMETFQPIFAPELDQSNYY